MIGATNDVGANKKSLVAQFQKKMTEDGDLLSLIGYYYM